MDYDINRLKEYITNLDIDIANRMPWGDLFIEPGDPYNKNVPQTRFWTTPNDFYENHKELWNNQYNVRFIFRGDYLTYFTTSTLIDCNIQMDGAEEAYVCPSPASTLIMLQTKAKDLLKKLDENNPQEITKTSKKLRYAIKKKISIKLLKR